MKFLFPRLLLPVVWIVASIIVSPQARAAAKPNIIWIIPDDLGYGDLGCYGCKDTPTPNIDSLAADGHRCETFYAAAPTCTPSRACILTGRYPETMGLSGALMGKGGMPTGAITMAETLKANGYKTALIGKWHLGYSGDQLPNAQGFDEFYGFRGGKIDYFKHTDTAQAIKGSKEGKHDFYENEKEIFPTGYSTDLFTERALQFVEQNKQHPFFLMLAYNAPHYARPGVLQAPDDLVRKFTKGKQPTFREIYTAMVSRMDEGIGQLLQALKNAGIDQQTWIVFVSDNGADAKSGGCNQPYSGGKWNYKEGGIRVPMITRWPGKIPPGSSSKAAIHMIDIFPTTLAALQLPLPNDLSLPGLNVLDCLTGTRTSLPERPLFFGKEATIRAKWKAIGPALYDLESDPQEAHDLASQYAETLQELHALKRP